MRQMCKHNIMEEIFVPLSFFGAVVAIIYLNIRKKERMALLQFGKDASVFRTTRSTNPSLKYGLLLVFLGVALLIANYMATNGIMQEEPAYFSMLSLGAGLSLLIYYFLDRKAPEDQDESVKKTSETNFS